MPDINDLIAIKDELKKQLNDTEKADLESIFNGAGSQPSSKSYLIFSAILLLLIYLTSSTIIWPFILGFVLFGLLFELITWNNYRLEKDRAIKRFVEKWKVELEKYYKRHFDSKLKEKLLYFSLRSLKNIDTSIDFEIKIGNFDPIPDGLMHVRRGVFIDYTKVLVSIKCDFRIIRTHLTKEQVSWVFNEIGNVCTGIDPKNIKVVQYSSTKRIVFGSDFIESGILTLLQTRRINTSRSQSPIVQRAAILPEKTIPPSSPLAKKPSGSLNDAPDKTPTRECETQEIAPSSPESAKPYKLPLGQSKMSPIDSLIQPLANRFQSFVSKGKGLRHSKVSKIIEVEAMRAVINYEKARGQKVKNVSNIYCGYDLESTGPEGFKAIEVKGKGRSGDIILTANEWRIAKDLKKDYYLYIVEHIFSKEHKSNPKIKIFQDPYSYFPNILENNHTLCVSTQALKAQSESFPVKMPE